MKKYFIIITFLFLIAIPQVKATGTFHDVVIDQNGQFIGDPYFILCGYALNGNESDKDSMIYFNIRYDKKNGMNFVGSYYHGGWQGGAVSSASGKISNHETLYMDVNEKNNLMNYGVCPKYVYIDNNFDHEFCLDSDGSYCKNRGKDISTSFSDSKNNGHLVYSITDDINDFFNDFSFNETMILNEDYNLGTDVDEKFRSEVLYGLAIPDFIANSEAYIKGYEELQERYETYSNNVYNKYEQEYEKGKITDEEWEKTKTTIEQNTQTQIANLEYSRVTGSKFDFSVGDGCTSILGSRGTKGSPAYYLDFAFNILKYAAIVMLLVFTILDFTKAVASSDNDSLKKALQKAIKRIIICVVIFFLPILINFVLELLGIVDSATCGIGVN